jgi:hypothetical protein
MLKTVGNPSTRFGDQTIVNGNLVIGTAGKGIDFSADGQAAGMTSELLDDYEEGTFTPLMSANGEGIDTWTSTTATGIYTKIGRKVFVDIRYIYTARQSNLATYAFISGLPFAEANRTPFVPIELTIGGAYSNVWSAEIRTSLVRFIKDHNDESPFYAIGSDFPASGTINIQMCYEV